MTTLSLILLTFTLPLSSAQEASLDAGIVSRDQELAALVTKIERLGAVPKTAEDLAAQDAEIKDLVTSTEFKRLAYEKLERGDTPLHRVFLNSDRHPRMAAAVLEAGFDPYSLSRGGDMAACDAFARVCSREVFDLLKAKKVNLKKLTCTYMEQQPIFSNPPSDLLTLAQMVGMMHVQRKGAAKIFAASDEDYIKQLDQEIDRCNKVQEALLAP